MADYRCECGKCVFVPGSFAPQDCQGCNTCGKTFSNVPDGHKTKQLHTPNKVQDDPVRYICTVCHSFCNEDGTDSVGTPT